MTRFTFGEAIEDDDILDLQGIEYHLQPIGWKQQKQIIRAVRDTEIEVTQFEALTAAAYVAFAAAGVQVAVVEAGLGGRLDATNVLARSRVQVLTNCWARRASGSPPRSWQWYPRAATW